MAEILAAKLATDLAIEAIKALTKLVIGRAAEETRLAWGSKDQLRKLSRKLELVGALLQDLSHSDPDLTQKSALVDTWLKRVKEVFYLADNVMDEYAYDKIRRKLEHKNQSIVFRYRMYLKVRGILPLFDDIVMEAKEIGLDQVKLARDAVAGHSNTDHNLIADSLNQAREFASPSNGFVGRVNDEKILLERLCNPAANMGSDDISIIAITGMGGIGKTTLARHLYDHANVIDHFADKKHWICVSKNFDIKRLLNEMLQSVTSEGKMSNIDALIGKLQKYEHGKRILLVLDDVWNEDKELWDSLKGSLRRIGALRGSVILITTRNLKVAESAGDASPHPLKKLSREESWALLKHNGLVSENLSNVPRQEEVARRILQKCGGVPLAINAIAGVLQNSPYLHEWELIERSELWNLLQGQNKILPSLMLSFNHLPSPSLKQCFACLSIFPRKWHVYKSELIGLWSSQGYLCDNKSRTSVELGEDYIKVLLDSSLLQAKMENGGKYVLYNMHDLVHDLTVYVSGKDLIKEATDPHEIVDCRHLTFTLGMNQTISEAPPDKALRRLRTIWLTGYSVPWNILIEARYLHTLFLVNTGITEVPPAIGLLKHLRYLDLSHNPLKTLPDSIGVLYQLQTLVLQDCKYLTELPKAIYSLVNLRYICTKTRMCAWKGLAQLTNLQALPCLDLKANEEGWSIDELGQLTELGGDIDIGGLQCVKDKEEARKAGLAEKAKVSKLTLSWEKSREASHGVSDEDVIDGLEPHPNITSVEVKNFYGDTFPTWIMTMAVLTEQQRASRTLLTNLTVVKLLNCIRCRTLPTLGKLPLLKCLILTGFNVVSIGSEFYGNAELHARTAVAFQCLQRLEISDFQSLTTWITPPQEAFPCLEFLRLTNCSSLNSVPTLGKSLTSVEFKGLDSVKTLDIIRYCRKLQILCLEGMNELRSLPIGLHSLESLESLKLMSCFALESLPDYLLHAYSSLHTLEICFCPRLRKIPRSLERCTSLEALSMVGCPMIESPPTNFRRLARLRMLATCYYPANHIRSLLEAIQHLPELHLLAFNGFRSDDELRDFCDTSLLNSLLSLTTLMFNGRANIKALPQQLGLLTRVETLQIWYFDDLETIPDWICNITSLKVLYLGLCDELKYLPAKEVWQRLPRLTALTIVGCPLLAERYNGGPERHNISHIEYVRFEGSSMYARDGNRILNYDECQYDETEADP